MEWWEGSVAPCQHKAIVVIVTVDIIERSRGHGRGREVRVGSGTWDVRDAEVHVGGWDGRGRCVEGWEFQAGRQDRGGREWAGKVHGESRRG